MKVPFRKMTMSTTMTTMDRDSDKSTNPAAALVLLVFIVMSIGFAIMLVHQRVQISRLAVAAQERDAQIQELTVLYKGSLEREASILNSMRELQGSIDRVLELQDVQEEEEEE